jgi:hypothetical protein
MKRTIASLALLRMVWDKYKKDYIEVFVPFIVTLISKKKYRVITEGIIRQDFKEEYGLLIPYYPMITLLRRTQTRGYIEKKDKKQNIYVPVKNLVDGDEFAENAITLERKYNRVLECFKDFCSKYEVELDLEGADRILIAFLKEYDLDILFASREMRSLLPDVSTNDKEIFLISKFIQEANQTDPDIFGFMVDIAFGHIIANAILYNVDLEKFQGKLSSNCYLDTGILFDLLGINYETRQSASKELVKSFTNNGSKVYVFRHTYDELLGILNSCIDWVDNDLYDPSKASRTLLFFKDQGFTGSEVESFILSIDKKLKELNIDIVSAPDPNDKDMLSYQIDEKGFLELLIKTYKQQNPYFDESDKDFTLYQDVKSISAVNKLRRGYKPLKLSDAKHIFITSNSTLAYASRQYENQELASKEGYDANSYFFIPSTMTDIFIGTLLWGQSPSSDFLYSINQKKLISNCYASMQPTKQLLKKFADAAEREYKKGTVNKDEYTLLKVSRMARNLLSEETLNDPDLFTEKTIPEILEEMRNVIRVEEESKFNIERGDLESRDRQLAETLDITNRKLVNEINEKSTIINNIETNADRVSGVIGQIALIVLALLAVVAVVCQFIPSLLGDNLIVRILLGVVAFIFTMASLFTGFNIIGARDSIKKKIKLFIIYRFIKADE